MPNRLTTPKDQRPACAAPGCGRDGRLVKGYCSRHYMQVRNHGRLTPERERRVVPPKPRPTAPCREPGCRKPGSSAHGWCMRHYQRNRRAGTLPPSKLLRKLRKAEELLAECRKLLDKTP